VRRAIPFSSLGQVRSEFKLWDETVAPARCSQFSNTPLVIAGGGGGGNVSGPVPGQGGLTGSNGSGGSTDRRHHRLERMALIAMTACQFGRNLS
jgi:hypothetical protein